MVEISNYNKVVSLIQLLPQYPTDNISSCKKCFGEITRIIYISGSAGSTWLTHQTLQDPDPYPSGLRPWARGETWEGKAKGKPIKPQGDSGQSPDRISG